LPGVSSSPRDAMLVREFALSRTMLDHLEKENEYAKHYRDPSIDFWSRLASDAGNEELYTYYTSRLSVNYSASAGTLSLRVRAFDPEKAQELAAAILKASESMVNKMSERAREDRLNFVKGQVDDAEVRLASARKAVLALQAEGHELNPTESASAVIGVRTQLESQLAQAKAELSALQSVMTAEAPKVRAQRQKVRSLQGQVKAQSKRLVDSEGTSINASIAEFEPLLFEKEVAQHAFETALRALELAHAEVLREQRYLVTISEPSLADSPTRPRRLWGIATVFVISLVMMGVLGMLGAALREHAKF